MISISADSGGNIVVLEALGKLTDSDYREILIPRLEAIIREHGKARVLFNMGDNFHGWEPAAAWDDARFGLAHRNDFEKFAIVGGPKWVEWGMKLGALFMSGETRSFDSRHLHEGLAWIRA